MIEESQDSIEPAPDIRDPLLGQRRGNENSQPLSPREQKVSLSEYQTTRSLTSSSEDNNSLPALSAINPMVEIVRNNEQSGANFVDSVNHAWTDQSPKTSTPNPELPSRSRSRNIQLDSDSGAVGFSPVRRRGTGSTISSESTGLLFERPSRRTKRVSFVDPLDIRVPLAGFEVMEQRAKFTVFKLHVHKGNIDNWFVFRRYTDFVQLQQKLRRLFPMFRLPLPPKRWFKSNFDHEFLDDRMHGLQAFIDSVVCHSDLCNCVPVQEFFCFTDPPGPHDSVEESRAYCEELEESVYDLRKSLRNKDTEIDLLKDELALYKNQVTMLTNALRESNSSGTIANGSQANASPVSSLAECDLPGPDRDQVPAALQVSSANKNAHQFKHSQSEISIQAEIIATSPNERMLQTDISKMKEKQRNFSKVQSCGSAFQCDNHKCIEPDLTCDRVDHCGDYSDESAEGPAQCGVKNENFLTKFLSLGVAASVGIIVGGLIVCIFCTAALVCCCRNSFCQKPAGSTSGGTTTGTTATLLNGGPGSHHGSHHGSVHGSQIGSHHGNGHVQAHVDRGGVVHHPMMSPFTNPAQQGYYPMHPVYPSPHGSVYSAQTQNSGFTRDSGIAPNQFGYSSSVYSSQAPSYHRSHTPTSSKSGKSHHSNNSVTYTHNTEKVMVNL